VHDLYSGKVLEESGHVEELRCV